MGVHTDIITYGRLGGRLGGHTEIRTRPNCILIKFFLTKFIFYLQYPVIQPDIQLTNGYSVN